MRRTRLRLGWEHLARHRTLFAAALISRAVWEIVPMQVPLLAGAAVDGLSGKGLKLPGFSRPAMDPEQVLSWVALGLAAVALLHSLSAYAYTMIGAALDKRFVTGLRKSVLDKTILLSLDQHRKFGHGELFDNTLRHTDRLRGFTERVFTRSASNVARVLYPVAMLFAISPALAAVALAVVPPQWILVWFLQRRLHLATRRSLTSHSDLTADLHEHLDGIETLKALDAGGTSVHKLRRAADRVEEDELATDRISALIRTVTWAFTGLGIALVWWLGGNRVLEGSMTIGSLIAVTGFTEFAYRPLRLFTNIVKTYRTGVVSLERVQALLETEPGVRDREGAQILPASTGPIELRGVSFSCGGTEILRGLDIRIEAGEFTAIVGPNGAGKSSLLRLLTKLCEPCEGEIRFAGQPLATATAASIHARISFVPQRAVLFSGTIMENLRLTKPDASEEEVRAACRVAEATDIIDRLAQGFETRIGRGGVVLSAGETQRLAIARALVGQPNVLFMDEPTASVDPVSEAAIVRSLMNLRGRMTLVLVGHRPRAVRGADRIYIVEGGRIAETGTHEELLLRSSFYRELFHTGETEDARNS